MRLLNLQNFDHADQIAKIYDQDHVDKILNDFLIQKGLKYLQHGGYSAVYTDDRVVYKIYSDDPVYTSYLDLIQKVPDEYKEFVPRIIKVQSFDKNPDIKIVVLEKLQEYSGKQNNKTWNKINRLINHSSDILENSDPNIQKIVHQLGKPFIEFALWVKSQLDLEELDFHYMNIMWRKNTPVLIDP